MIITETERLRIRRMTVDDAEFVLGLVNEPSFLANIGDKGVRTLDDARRFIDEGPWAEHREQGYGQFVVELKDGGAAIGVCGLLRREAHDLTDVGFAVLPDYWRCGYAFDAAVAVMEYGRTVLGIDRIVGLTSEDNHPSIGVLEKLGMSFEGIIKMADDDPGTALYS